MRLGRIVRWLQVLTQYTVFSKPCWPFSLHLLHSPSLTLISYFPPKSHYPLQHITTLNQFAARWNFLLICRVIHLQKFLSVAARGRAQRHGSAEHNIVYQATMAVVAVPPPQLLLMPSIFSKCAGVQEKLLGRYRYELILNSDSDNQWCGLESVYQLHN